VRIRPRDKQSEAWQREGKYARVWEQLIQHHHTTVEFKDLTMTENMRFDEVQKLMVAAHLWARARDRKVRCKFDKTTGQVYIEITQ
jgi:beta-N-acetylglucosaminidase